MCIKSIGIVYCFLPLCLVDYIIVVYCLSLTNLLLYHKIPIISPGLIFLQKAVLLGLFSGVLISEGLIIGRNFVFQNVLGLTTKIA